MSERKDFRKRIHILKNIHRKLYLQKQGEAEFQPLEKIEKLCVVCGKEFTPEYRNTKYCPLCQPQNVTPSDMRRAEKWSSVLKEHFKDAMFVKEDVSRFFECHYSMSIVRKTLLVMSKTKVLRLIRGSGYHPANKYAFTTTAERGEETS